MRLFWLFVIPIGLLIIGCIGFLEKIFNFEMPTGLRYILLIAFIIFSISQMIKSYKREEESRSQIQSLTDNECKLWETAQKAEIASTEAIQKQELLEYQDISLFNVIGNKSGKVMGIPFIPTPINNWSVPYIVRSKDEIDFKCSPESIDACELVIKKIPLYPFSYYFLAKCQKEQNDKKWQANAQKARDILKRTTTITGHHGDHDIVLKQITLILK